MVLKEQKLNLFAGVRKIAPHISNWWVRWTESWQQRRYIRDLGFEKPSKHPDQQMIDVLSFLKTSRRLLA